MRESRRRMFVNLHSKALMIGREKASSIATVPVYAFLHTLRYAYGDKARWRYATWFSSDEIQIPNANSGRQRAFSRMVEGCAAEDVKYGKPNRPFKKDTFNGFWFANRDGLLLQNAVEDRSEGRLDFETISSK